MYIFSQLLMGICAISSFWAVQNYIAISILSPSVHTRVFLVCARAGGAEVQIYGFQFHQVPFWRSWPVYAQTNNANSVLFWCHLILVFDNILV